MSASPKLRAAIDLRLGLKRYMQMNVDPRFSDHQKSTPQMMAIVEAALGLPPLNDHDQRIARLRPHLPSEAEWNALWQERCREREARWRERQAEWEEYRRRSAEFYNSEIWRETRYRALKRHGARCQCCGRSGRDVELHVDHIKPRWRYPQLELDPDNLQVLCADCNLGKRGWDETDWR
jgi:5-methylcytosine-specific restriction endonuclease McrA